MDAVDRGLIMAYNSPNYSEMKLPEKIGLNNIPYWTSDIYMFVPMWNSNALPDLELNSWMDLLYPQLKGKNCYLNLFKKIVQTTASMIAGWQAQGFAHGVMNTDNMSILGLTIDYGPFSFMENYNPSFICNHSDNQGRYSFERQPGVALWNLERLADSLKNLISETDLKDGLAEYQPTLIKEYSALMRRKFGLLKNIEGDSELINDFLELLYINKKDYHRSMRQLTSLEEQSLGANFNSWFKRYYERVEKEDEKANERNKLMNSVNPKYVLRNYLAEVAIRKAEDLNDYEEIDTLFNLLKSPFENHKGFEAYDNEAPDWAQNLELSCSS